MLETLDQRQKSVVGLIGWDDNIYFIHTSLLCHNLIYEIKGACNNRPLAPLFFQISVRIGINLITALLHCRRRLIIIIIKQELMQPLNIVFQTDRNDTGAFRTDRTGRAV